MAPFSHQVRHTKDEPPRVAKTSAGGKLARFRPRSEKTRTARGMRALRN
jgi:hypothetical protein